MLCWKMLIPGKFMRSLRFPISLSSMCQLILTRSAYKDELPPRILVQVKNQDGDIWETTIQSLKGAMREGDYGLSISLSGYTKNARKYLDSTPIIRAIDGDELVTLVLKYYENLSPKYKKVIPLERVYIPVPADE